MELFWLTVIGGFVKWLYSAFIKKDVSTLDTIALVYSIVFFIILLVYQPDKPKNVDPPIRNPIDAPQNSDLKKIQERDKEWRESVGTGVLDNE